MAKTTKPITLAGRATLERRALMAKVVLEGDKRLGRQSDPRIVALAKSAPPSGRASA
ncbi:hypothetical protein Back2_02310 [Nocardioides baekrokdamisoli]|uniref:Uncharacterized protein n=1 Tax=Nocardioides baekrokdamisoli TaxID=1804624 RepID=A0A3G9IXP3_9ACTN|nr:hypothetical protein [Nocardioides baekrokdamisoli]BBH15944.1 hypothetical protein Back2_02310 [Nocardioides baekrokdamisoli]